jgi:hypothetical protein
MGPLGDAALRRGSGQVVNPLLTNYVGELAVHRSSLGALIERSRRYA